MKKSIYFLSLVLSIAATSLFVACGNDDGGPDIDDIIDETPAVADGIYILGSASFEDPSDTVKMAPGYVGAGELREGFYEAYIYLGAGSFNFVFYADEEPTTYGGTVESFPLTNNANYSYQQGTLTADGAAITIADAGLYHVHLDQTSDLFFVTMVDYFEIIGSSTEDAWNAGQELAEKSASANEVVFEGTNIILRAGAYKFRYNSNWDTNLAELSEGLNLHSNFGVDGIAGGTDFTFDGTDGAYTVTITYTPGVGASLEWDLVRTGDAPEITFDPAEYPWSLRGTAVGSPEDWSAGPLLTPNHDGTTTYRWYGVIQLSEGEFKVADGTTWLGVGGVTDNSGVLTGTDNLIVAAEDAGFYYVTVTTADEGSTWNVTIDKASFGVIGSATAAITGGDGWASDIDMTEDENSFTLTTDLGVGEYKFRANDAWEYNLGGDMGGLTHNGANLAIATEGSYTITLTTADRGVTYTATIE